MRTVTIRCLQASLFRQPRATSTQVSAVFTFITAPERALPVLRMDHSGMVSLLQHTASGSVTTFPATLFLQAVCHKWPQSFALAACTQLAMNYMDDVSLTEDVLLEPAKVALMVERGPVDTPSHQEGTQGGPSWGTPRHQQGVHGRTPQVRASALPLSMSNRQLSLPRPEPCSQGLCVQTRWGLLFTHHYLQRRLT